MEIILASSSPRRTELLSKYKIKHKVEVPDVNEKIYKYENPKIVVSSLSFQKSYNISRKYPDDLVIAADTIVSKDSIILGKAKNKIEAFKMLSNLSNETHDVYTGISMICLKKNIKIIDCVTTKVKFRKLSKAEINFYIDTSEPIGKAGAYAIQGMGGLLVEKIEGSYTNVIGLPMEKLYLILKEQFNINILQ